MTTILKKGQKVFTDFLALHNQILRGLQKLKSLNNNIPGKAARSNEANQFFSWFFGVALQELANSFHLDFFRIVFLKQSVRSLRIYPFLKQQLFDFEGAIAVANSGLNVRLGKSGVVQDLTFLQIGYGLIDLFFREAFPFQVVSYLATRSGKTTQVMKRFLEGSLQLLALQLVERKFLARLAATTIDSSILTT